jgi:hypothetical protein
MKRAPITRAVYSSFTRGWKLTDRVVTYSFPDGPPDGELTEEWLGPLDPELRDSCRRAFDVWARFIDLTFVEIIDPAQVMDAYIRFARTTSGNAFYPDQQSDQVIWLGGLANAVVSAAPEGSHTFRMLMHEIGHCLGLRHPQEGDPCDTYLQSLMSYRDYGTDEPDLVRGANLYQATPMLADVVALQTIYGESKATYGDTVHKLSAVQAPLVIFDYAGTDTIDASELERGISVNLYEEGATAKAQQLGSRLTINEDGVVRNFERTVWLVGKLENVIGTQFGDFIRGGILANLFQGGPGDDTLHGGGGGDTLSGDEGNDTLIGGEGNDTLIGGPGADTFIAAPGDVIRDYEVGVDRVVAP